MFNVKTILRQALLALALAGSSLAAVAGPVSFHVDLDTRNALDAEYVNLQFIGFPNTPSVSATLSNFTGAFDSLDWTEGIFTVNADGSMTLANAPDFSNAIGFGITSGGLLGFDIAFSDDLSGDTSGDGSSFSVAFLDAAFAPVGGDLGVATFELTSGSGITASTEIGFAAIGPVVAEVPEPSELLLMLTGLGLMAVVVRRRKAKAVG